MVAAAIGAATAVSAATSAISGFTQAGAAGQASQEQVAAQKAAIGDISQYYGKGVDALQPFQTEGVQAGGKLSDLLGIGSGGQAGALSTLQNLPGFEFALGQGQQAQSTGITARGLGLSGAQLRGASDYAQGTADQQYNNYASQLYQLLGLGENAGQGIATLSGNAGNATANAAVGIGNAQAAGTLGAAAGTASAINGIGGAVAGGVSQNTGYNLYQNLLAQQGATGGGATATGFGLNAAGYNPSSNTVDPWAGG